MNIKRFIWEYFLILAGSALYAVSTVIFIFPCGLLLGGTSGISVILTSVISSSPGVILMLINFLLIILAFAVLGRGMAVKTLVGSVFTTLFVGLFERLAPTEPTVANLYLSALIGASIIAVASGIMFYVDSSSGGTDIVALIVKRFSGIHIGRALLITDVLIVAVGGLLSGVYIFIGSFIGLLVKTFGIDFVISVIKRLKIGEGRENAG